MNCGTYYCMLIKYDFVDFYLKLEKNMREDNYTSIYEAAKYWAIKTVMLRNWIKKKPDMPVHRVEKL